MNGKWNRFWRWRPGRGRAEVGLTLIEVVAALAILGALLGAVVTARTRHLHQWAQANRRLEATAAAEALLTGWWTRPVTMPRRASGAVAGHDALAWRTRPIDSDASDALDALGAQVVRLEIVEARGPVDGQPLVMVDLVLPREAAEHE